VGRAFVVNEWYITTYTPIYNLEKRLIGILYTGILEAKYRDIKWRLIWINLGITLLGMVIAFLATPSPATEVMRVGYFEIKPYHYCPG